MRSTVLVLVAALGGAANAHANMPRPADLSLDCGRVVYAGVVAASGDNPAGAEFELVRYGITHLFFTDDHAASALAAGAVGADENVVVVHEPGGALAALVEIGAPGASCWEIEDEARAVYQDAYDARGTETPPPKHAHIQRIPRIGHWRRN